MLRKCSKLCAHTFACAFIDNSLQTFLNTFKTAKPPNLHSLAKYDILANPGRKPNKSRKASKKSSAKELQAAISDACIQLPSSRVTLSLINPNMCPPSSSCHQAGVSPGQQLRRGTTTWYYKPTALEHLSFSCSSHSTSTYSPFSGHSSTVYSPATNAVISLYPFTLKVLTSHIKIYQGCRIPFLHTDQAFYDIVVSRKEYRPDKGPDGSLKTPMTPSSSDYHVNMHCLQSVDPSFVPTQLVVPDFIFSMLGIYIHVPTH